MKQEELKNLFQISDLIDLPRAITQLLDGDLVARNEVYKELLRLNNNDLSYDWFQDKYNA